jgi:tRNA threonylcarbamoyladenosine dehydratase
MSADGGFAELNQRVTGPLERLYGSLGVARLGTARVVVVGVGGVGSWVAEGLARSGVGHLTLIDMDHVAPSNVNRQVHAGRSTFGQSKVLAMQDRIRGFDVPTQIQCIDDFVTPENWPSLLQGQPIDLLVDACDDFRAKLTLAKWAILMRLRCVVVGSAGGKRLAHRTRLTDLSEVTHDPLLAKLRYTLRREQTVRRTGRIGISCVSSDEPIQRSSSSCEEGFGQLRAQPGAPLACHGYGSSVAVTAAFGFVAVGAALDWLCTDAPTAPPAPPAPTTGR